MQIKFLKNEKNGKVAQERYSRGVAFVEFSEHQHALVALRVLNNNPGEYHFSSSLRIIYYFVLYFCLIHSLLSLTPETFGPEHRPIVEFALDNVQTLKLRNAKLQFQQQAPQDDNNGMKNDKPGNKEDHKQDRKRKSREHGEPGKETVVNTNGESGDTLANEKSKRQKGNKKNKRALKENPEALSMKPKNNQNGQKNGGASAEDQNTAPNRRKSGNKDDDTGFRKRKMQNQEQEAGQKMVSKKRPKKNKGSVGKDVVDKLDMLIEQYRSKFSHKSSQENGEKKPSKQVRKWFQS